jgi:Fis family transcriptional regulator, factor for inversion stimulation protein
MPPRCWLPRRSWRLEHNQCHSLFLSCPPGRLTVKEQLERLVLQMYRSGTAYSKAVREFQKAFIITVLRDLNGNQVRAAGKLGMHRNTLRRNLQELDVDVKAVRVSRRRPPVSAPLSTMKEKRAGVT